MFEYTFQSTAAVFPLLTWHCLGIDDTATPALLSWPLQGFPTEEETQMFTSQAGHTALDGY